jgi:uncharacterized repeat protein (TIGR01451 family)
MKNNHNNRRPSARSSILALLLLAFGFAQAATLTPTVTPACSGSDGAVSISISGGTSGYTFYLYGYNGGNYPQQTSPTFTGLGVGYYQVTAYNGSDSGSTSFLVTNKVTIAINDLPTTCPLNQGSITATGGGGTAPYSYSWSNGVSGTNAISNLAGGNYNVTVTDASGCTATFDTMVTATSPMSVTIANNGITCNPTLTATATGSTGTVHYAWSNGATSAAVSGLNSGYYYTVTATDGNGCTASQNSFYTSVPLVIDSMIGVTYPSCTGGNGSITPHVTSGTAPYTYAWSTGATGPLTGLSAGTYTVTVTDANGCQGSFIYYLSSTQLAAGISITAAATCGNSDGALGVSVYNGTSPYHYSWSDGSTASTLTGLPAGTYTLTVSDASGCSATSTQTLVSVGNYSVSVTTTPTACNTSIQTGTATAVITGTGTAPYSFNWITLYSYPQVSLGTTQTITGLGTGDNIALQVTDGNGCIPLNANSAGQIYDSTFIALDPSCYDHITGYVYNDANANCVHDAGEIGVGSYVTANSTSNGSFYATTDSTGYYDISVLPGTYTVTMSIYNGGTCSTTSCTSGYTATFAANSLVSSGNDFGIAGTAAYDLGVHMGDQSSAPGTQRQYWVYYYNWGETAVASGVLTFIYDGNLSLDSTVPAYSSINTTTHTITWNITNNLAPQQWLNDQHLVRLYFEIPATLPLGTLLSAHSDISPTANDCDPSDNSQDFNDLVSGSHDPNEKEVSPAGNLTVSDTVLTYTIRFQNNGNAPANSITVTDTLSANVNPASVRVVSFSNTPKYTISGRNILTFTFQGINLPDSVHDEPHSKGFVTYTVHTKPNLPIGSTVNNTAYIYFDANPAVVTNTTVSERSDFQTGIKSVSGSGNMAITVSPNPVQDKALVHISGATGEVRFDLADVTGQKVMETTTSNTDLTLASEMFAPGMYIYTARDAAGHTLSGKVLIAH